MNESTTNATNRCYSCTKRSASSFRRRNKSGSNQSRHQHEEPESGEPTPIQKLLMHKINKLQRDKDTLRKNLQRSMHDLT
jgi:hypothetical protein